MEVTALCITLLLMLQPSRPQTAGAALRLVPTRLQLFEYQSVRFTCEGFNVSAGCRVRNTEEFISKCSNSSETSAVTCTIDFAFVSDSGEYWCEGGGRRSNSVNVSVTAGSVILESPVLPVTEGDAVTLSCRDKTASSNLTADFYKDGRLIRSSSTGNMTIQHVSRSDEGLYRCHISGAGESPESWLAVRGGDVIMESPALPVTEGDAVTLRCRAKEPPSDSTADFYKDGRLIRSSSAGEMTISSVSRSDEGRYRCHISGAGGSAESWLAVREVTFDSSVKHREDSNTPCAPEMKCSLHYYVLLWVVVAVVMFLQLLVMGLLHWKKRLVLLKAAMCDPNRELFDKTKNENAADAADNLSLDTNHGTKPRTDRDEDESLPQSFHSTFIVSSTL